VSCNGLITAYIDPILLRVRHANANVRLMARKLANFANDTTPDDNHVVSAYRTWDATPARTTSSSKPSSQSRFPDRTAAFWSSARTSPRQPAALSALAVHGVVRVPPDGK